MSFPISLTLSPFVPHGERGLARRDVSSRRRNPAGKGHGLVLLDGVLIIHENHLKQKRSCPAPLPAKPDGFVTVAFSTRCWLPLPS